MSGFRIDVDYDDRQIARALRRIGKRVGDLRPIFADIGEYLTRSHEDRWEAGRDPAGMPWVPLKPATVARKRTGRILYEEGDLLRGPVYRALRDSLAFGISDFKAPFHQFGTSRGLPARELLGIDDADEAEILDILGDYLLTAVKP